MSYSTSQFSKAKLDAARERIKPYVHNTAVLSSNAINTIVGAELYFKCENFQKIGAFKMRGGINAVLQLSDEQKSNGLVTHSSGNHAQAVAKAAQLMEIPSYIIMPENAPKIKVAAVKEYGGNIHFCDATQPARTKLAEKVRLETGATFIHPYDNENIILGQGSAATELFEEVANLDALVTPIGGGGLLSGSLLSASYYNKECKVYGVEPEGANGADLSIKANTLTPHANPTSIADGLLASLGELNFNIINSLLTDNFVVNEEEIKAALKLIYERLKIVVEPSSAVALAGILKHKTVFKSKKVGIILTGGNMDLAVLKSFF